MLCWLREMTGNSSIRKRMERQATRRDISRIISNYMASPFYTKFQVGKDARKLSQRRSESALQVAERQMDTPIAGYYSYAHPEMAGFIGEDWGADHTDNLRRTASAHGEVISDPGSFYLEVIAPELALLWIIEDLQIDKVVANTILSSSLASYYGRLVLEEDCVLRQEEHSSVAHSDSGGTGMAGLRKQGRKRRQRICK